MKTAFPSLLILLATLTSSGCIVIEKKTLVMIVPPESNEIQLYYLFEGISVLEHKDSTLKRAQRDLDALNKDDLSFFGSGTGKDEHLLRQARFEKLRFFVDPERERTLCADRRVTILARAEFAKILNKFISNCISKDLFRGDEKEIQEEIKKAREELKVESDPQWADEWGMGPLWKTVVGLVQLLDSFDLASIKQLNAAVNDGFRWIRFESDTVQLVLPATAACARQIATNPKSKDWLKEMRTFVEPIDLQTCADGLAIVLGRKGQVIRLSYADRRPHRPSAELALAKYAGSPKAIMLDDKPANADRLIKQFIAEKLKKR